VVHGLRDALLRARRRVLGEAGRRRAGRALHRAAALERAVVVALIVLARGARREQAERRTLAWLEDVAELREDAGLERGGRRVAVVAVRVLRRDDAPVRGVGVLAESERLGHVGGGARQLKAVVARRRVVDLAVAVVVAVVAGNVVVRRVRIAHELAAAVDVARVDAAERTARVAVAGPDARVVARPAVAAVFETLKVRRPAGEYERRGQAQPMDQPHVDLRQFTG